MHNVIEDEKFKILKEENKIVNSIERLRILRSIYSQPITYFTIKTNRPFIPIKNNNFITTKQYILNSHWL